MRPTTLTLRAAGLAASLVLFSTPALADQPAPGGEHAQAQVGADAHHDGGLHFTGDADGDGTPNWLDPDADADVGPGTFVRNAIAFHVINLAILAALMYFGGRNGIRDALHRRAVGIRTEVEEAAEARQSAQQRHEAVAARLAALETEIATLKDRARAEAAAEEQRIRQRAEEAAAHVAETAQRQIGAESVRARAAIRAEAVDLAVQLAEGILRENVAAADQRRLAEQFLRSVEGEA